MEYKVISHAERMNNKSLKKECPVSKAVPTKKLVEEKKVDESGRVVKVLKGKLVDPTEKFAGFKVTDFCIENLEATGAIANLKNCVLNGSIEESITKATNVLESLENINISEVE